MLHNEPLLEAKVNEILTKDQKLAKAHGKSSFYTAVMESLKHIKDTDLRNQVFMHTVHSLKYALTPLQESTVSGQVAGYNKAMLPTIIRRVMPQVVATKFVATRQLDVPTQVIQTFRLNRKTEKNGIEAGAEFFDPKYNQRYPNTNPPTPSVWQGNRKGIDPNYSSQEVSGEVATGSLMHGPLIPGSLAVYQVNKFDPRDRTFIGSDNGSASIIAKIGGATIGTITSYGALNGAKPTIDIAALPSLPTATATADYQYEFDYSMALERNKDLSEVSFAMDLIQVTAKQRKNFAQISAEAIQDLEAYSDGKLDALKELVTAMTETMALEIDLELTNAMMKVAGKSAVWDAEYKAGIFRGTQAEYNETLVHRMNFLANDMSVDYLRGDDFFCITHPHLYTILQNTNRFRLAGADHDHSGEYSVGQTDKNLGLVDNFTICKSSYFPQSDKMLIGYTSKDLTKAPYAYFPYVTYLTPPTVDVLGGDMFSTVVGLSQRYDHKKLLDGEYGLGTLQVKNQYL